MRAAQLLAQVNDTSRPVFTTQDGKDRAQKGESKMFLSARLRTLCQGFLVLVFLATLRPSPCQEAKPEEVVRTYLEAWAKGDHAAMYALTTKAGRKQIAQEEFVMVLRKELHVCQPS